jgi:cyclase
MSKTIRPLSERLATLRIFEPGPKGVYAYYDGRVGGRLVSEEKNTIDDGAFVLGVATYAIVSGSEALFFDAGITSEHAKFMLDHVKGLGVIKVTLVYSHFHSDHIAGAVALKEATIIGHVGTHAHLNEKRQELADGIPPIDVVLPTQTYEKNMTLQVGNRTVELHNFNIHTTDGTILFLPDESILFAGDTLEDTVTYIDDVGSLSTHLSELKRMAAMPITKVLPAHGSPDRIASGGYGPSFIDATVRYIQAVDSDVREPLAWEQSLKRVVSADLDAGYVEYYEEYENVHRSNVSTIQSWRRSRAV